MGKFYSKNICKIAAFRISLYFRLHWAGTFTIFLRFAPPALWQSCDCPGASEITRNHIGTIARYQITKKHTRKSANSVPNSWNIMWVWATDNSGIYTRSRGSCFPQPELRAGISRHAAIVLIKCCHFTSLIKRIDPRHIVASWHGNTLASLALCEGNPPLKRAFTVGLWYFLFCLPEPNFWENSWDAP